jgi:hypothetical protein
MTVGFYKESKNDPIKAGRQVYYILGLADGLMASNSALRLKHQQMLYCQPGRLGLNEALVESMIDKELADNPAHLQYSEDVPIGIVLMNAMQNTFPCP